MASMTQAEKDNLEWERMLPVTIPPPDWEQRFRDSTTDGECAQINPLGFLLRILGNEELDILVFGEDKTFSTALGLAAMRGSFNRIWVSNDKSRDVKASFLLNRLEKNAKTAENRLYLAGRDEKFENSGFSERGSNVDGWKRTLSRDVRICSVGGSFDALNYNLSAGQIAEDSFTNVPKRIIWLNHPWTDSARDLATDLQEFMFACSQAHQENGGVVFITITRNERWRGYYGVKDLIAYAQKLGYSFSCDNDFMCHVFNYFGYRHLTWNEKYDIHYYVVPISTTLIFVKEGEE